VVLGTIGVTNWNSFGPFVTFNITPTVGVHTALGTISDTLVRSPNSANPGFLMLRMNVDSTDATKLDRYVDGGDGGSAGTVRYGFVTALGQDTLRYLVPVGSKC
jgi:hypothetical protein